MPRSVRVEQITLDLSLHAAPVASDLETFRIGHFAFNVSAWCPYLRFLGVATLL